MKTNYLIRHLLVLPAVFIAASAAAERTYKWTDGDGNINYSNLLPPESSQHERKEMNEQGRIVKVYSAPLTVEEKIEAQRLAELALKKKKRAKKRAIHDRSLLATYSNVEDMEKARDDKVSLTRAMVHLTNNRIKSMQERLLGISEEAAQFERSGKNIPFSLQSQINNLRDQIASNKRFAKYKLAEAETIKHKFELDIARYRALTSDKPKVVRRGPTPLEIAVNNPNISLDYRDRILLTTFSSVEDLLFARKEEIENMDSSIRQAYDRIDTMQIHLGELSNNADEYEADDEPLPDLLINQMKRANSEISETEKLLQAKRLEKQQILEQFYEDIQRFRVLTASN
jgi:hypothetical protein